MSDQGRAFRDALGCFGTGVTIVTTQVGDAPAIGITANSFSSVSLDPPLVLWCLDKGSDTFPVFERADYFAISVLGKGAEAVSNRFATVGNHQLDEAETELWDTGVPVLKEAIARFECRVSARHDAGDHIILVGEVLRFDSRSGDPLLYYRGKYAEVAD